jgi:hypothetical protein
MGLFKAGNLALRAYKIRVVDPTGRYSPAWVGGGDTFAAAPAFTPQISEETFTGTASLPLNDGAPPWTETIPPLTPPGAPVATPTWQTPPPPAARIKPRLLSRPTVRGRTQVGRLLRAVGPSFSGRPTSVKRDWYRDDHRIRGAHGRNYRLKPVDRGHRVTLRVTARFSGERPLTARSVPTRRVSRF